MSSRGDEIARTVAQGVAIVLLALIVGTILHKGYVDISRLAGLYEGGDFWRALGRYFFKNLAGGAG